jgi:hypothetical protein
MVMMIVANQSAPLMHLSQARCAKLSHFKLFFSIFMQVS